MAIDIIQDPSIKKAAQPGTSNNTAPQAPGSQASTASSSSSAPQQTQAPSVSSGKQGTGFTNIQKLLQANQGNRLGQSVASGITGEALKAKQNIEGARQQFGQQSEAGRVAFDPNQLSQAVVRGGQEDIDYVKGLIQGGYSGPESLAQASALQQQAAQAQALGQLAGTEAGRAGLLQQYVGGPQYSSGKQNLDALLLGMQGGKQLSEARRSTVGLAGQAQALEQEAIRKGQQYKQEGQEAAQTAAGVVGQAQTGIEQDVASRLQAEKNERAQLYKDYLANLSKGQLSPEQSSRFELSPGQQIYNVDPSKFLVAGEDPTRFNIATPEQYAQAQALAQMLGQTNTLLPQEYASQSGVNTPDISFRRSAFDQAIQNAQGGYNQDLENTVNQYLNTTGSMTPEAKQNLLGKGAQGWLENLNQVFFNNPNNAPGPAQESARAALMNILQTYQPNRTLSEGLAMPVKGSLISPVVHPKATNPYVT